jgi:nuclear pore complex protein Nup188
LAELPDIVVPAGVFGRVDYTDSGQQIIVWEFPYSGWHLFLLEMDALLHAVNLGSDIDSLPIVGRVTAICSLLYQILSSDYSLIESLDPLLQRVYAILQKFSPSHNPSSKLLEACLKCITAVAKIKPKQVWMCLQQTGYLPHTSAASLSQGMDVSPSNFGHILSIRERPSGQYPIALATLDLLATLVKGLAPSVDDDNCLEECPIDLVASVLFVVNDMFSSFHRWRYVDIKDRDILGHMSLEIFQLALTHGKPKQKDHTSLFGLVTHALLYSEAGQALLNIIATGVDAIDVFSGLQTSESDSRGLNLVLLIKKAFQVVTQLLRSTGEEVSVVEHALSSLMVDHPSLGVLRSNNGGSVHIVSVIASYIHHHQDPELPTLSTQLFKSLCVVSPMSMYGCLGSEEDSNSIRDGYVLRLNARTEDVGLKISILEFLASAVKTQPGLTEHFLDLERVSSESTNGYDSEKYDMGRNSCLSAVLSLVTNNPETLPLELLCAAFGFLESLWKNRKDAALAAIRSKDHFWESIASQLLKDIPQKATDDHYRLVSCAFQIVALEVFYVAEGQLDNNLCDVSKEFTRSNRFEYWTEVLKPEDSYLDPNVSDQCRLHFLRSWQTFVLVAVNCQPSVFGLNSPRMKCSLLECILETLHTQVNLAVSPYSIVACEELISLFSCILGNWIETVVDALDTLSEIVKILDCARNQDPRIFTAIEKAAFSSCIVLVQQLQTPTKETMWLPAVQLLQVVTLSLQQASFLDSSRPLKDMVVHVFLIEVLVKYLPAPNLWMPVLTENSSLLLLIQVLDSSLKKRTDVEFVDAVLHVFLSMSTLTEVAGSLTLLGVHQSLCLSLQRDDLPHNSTVSQVW